MENLAASYSHLWTRVLLLFQLAGGGDLLCYLREGAAGHVVNDTILGQRTSDRRNSAVNVGVRPADRNGESAGRNYRRGRQVDLKRGAISWAVDAIGNDSRSRIRVVSGDSCLGWIERERCCAERGRDYELKLGAWLNGLHNSSL